MATDETKHHDIPATPRGVAALLGAILAELAAASQGETRPRANLGQLFDRMRERAFGLLLLLLALPCCLPFVYGLPQVVALPMLVLCGQMALGHAAPWLPQGLRERSFAIDSVAAVVRRSGRYLAIVEWFAHPRLAGVTGRAGTRVTGGLLLVPTASILVPLPLTNTVPGIAVAIVSIGLIERDGLLVIGGLTLGLAWVAALVIGGQAAIRALIGLLSGSGG